MFLLVLILTFILIITYIYHKLTFWSRRGIPNDLSQRSRLPFHLSDLQSHQKYGKIVGFYEGLRPCLSVTDPQVIKKILVTEFHNFADHRALYGPTEPLAKALFFLPYHQWKRVRAILSPSFTSSKLKTLKPLIDFSLDSLINRLEEMAKDNQMIDLREYYDSFTFEVIAKCAFGLNLDTINNPKNIIFESAKKLFTKGLTLKTFILFSFPKLIRLFGLYFFDKRSQHLIADNVKAIIRQRIDNNIKVKDILQLILDSSELSANPQKGVFEKLTEEEVIAQTINFLAAGYETTATQLCFITQSLALNPYSQNRLVEEIRSTFGEESDISYDSIMKMTFLDAFCKEVMRTNCSVNRIDRKTVNECTIDGIVIPSDTSIVIPIWALHLDPDNYEDPDLFKPERFLPENIHSMKPYTYMPFATGPRNCIGSRFAEMEIKYFLVKILIRFQFQSCDQTNSLQFHKLNQVTNMKNLWVKIIPRNAQ